MSARKEKHVRLSPNLEADFVKTAKVLGLKQWQAAETAIREWVQRHHDEVQKRIDEYTERGGLVINHPQSVTVNVAVFQKAEVLVAKEELQRLLTLVQGNPPADAKHEFQLQLARALKAVQPVYVKTRDPQLDELVRQAEKELQD